MTVRSERVAVVCARLKLPDTLMLGSASIHQEKIQRVSILFLSFLLSGSSSKSSGIVKDGFSSKYVGQ